MSFGRLASRRSGQHWSRLMATGAGSRFGNEKGDLLVALAGTSLSG
jgi:hypothetical protein